MAPGPLYFGERLQLPVVPSLMPGALREHGIRLCTSLSRSSPAQGAARAVPSAGAAARTTTSGLLTTASGFRAMMQMMLAVACSTPQSNCRRAARIASTRSQ